MTISQYWLQIKELTIASIKARYRKTFAGFLWVILNPIMMFGVQSLVFKKFLQLEVPDYFLFLLGGLLPWIFFTSTVQMGTPVFATNAPLLKSFKVNPWVILISQVLDSFINFLASFVLILLPLYFFSDKTILTLILLPLALFPLFLGTLSFTSILSVLNVFHRDINFVVGFVFSLMFFLTPVFYPKEFIPDHYQWLVVFNPLIYFIEPFRLLILNTDLKIFGEILIRSFGVALLLTSLAIMIWKRKKNEFYQNL